MTRESTSSWRAWPACSFGSRSDRAVVGGIVQPNRSTGSFVGGAVCRPIFLLRRRLSIDRRPKASLLCCRESTSRKATSAAFAAPPGQHDGRLQESPLLARRVLLVFASLATSDALRTTAARSRSSLRTRSASPLTLVPSSVPHPPPSHNRRRLPTPSPSSVYRISCRWPSSPVYALERANDVIAGDRARAAPVRPPAWSAVVSTSVDARPGV